MWPKCLRTMLMIKPHRLTAAACRFFNAESRELTGKIRLLRTASEHTHGRFNQFWRTANTKKATSSRPSKNLNARTVDYIQIANSSKVERNSLADAATRETVADSLSKEQAVLDQLEHSRVRSLRRFKFKIDDCPAAGCCR